jgi:hypothetical protein
MRPPNTQTWSKARTAASLLSLVARRSTYRNRTRSKMAVTTTDTRSEPRHPRRLEKKRNIATSLEAAVSQRCSASVVGQRRAADVGADL